MTKKLNPLEDPPTASSSDDDEVETSAGEEGEEEDASSSEDDEPIKDLIKIPSSAAAPAKPTAGAKKGSDSDSGSETETDSDSETTNPPNSGSGKTVSVSAVSAADPPAALALPAVKTGTKRPASEGTSSKRAKKVVTSSGGEDEIVKKPAFQRLWSEEDEITVLQGIIDFKAETGKSLYDDSNGFYDFVKKSISFEVSKNQFMDKIRSLKKKYMGKEVKNGVEPSFLKAHDKKAFGLSKYIWGPDGIALESNVKSNGVTKKSQSKSKKLASVKQELSFVASPNGKSVEDDDNKVLSRGGEPDWFENSFIVRSIASYGVDEYLVRQRWSLVPAETKKMLEEKLKVLQAKEFEFVMEKTGFLHEVTSLIVEATKNKSQ